MLGASRFKQRHAKRVLREIGCNLLKKYGPDEVCMVINSEDVIHWECRFGEIIDPQVDGVDLLNSFHYPRNTVSVVDCDDFYDWQHREQNRYHESISNGKEQDTDIV